MMFLNRDNTLSKKIVTSAIAIVFLLSNLTWGQAAPAIVTPASTISIPEAIGTVDHYHQGTNGKTMVYIQDAHDSLQAQENIAKIIHHLVETQGVKTVFEEGYEGAVPTDDFFSIFKDPEVKEKVAYFLMDKLRLGGAEYAHINRNVDFDLIGVDSIQLHRENIEWYQKSAEKRMFIKSDLEAIHSEIRVLSNMYFPKELKEWIKLKDRLDNNQLQMLDYLKRIASGDNTHYPNINLIMNAASTEDEALLNQARGIDAKAFMEEIDQLENDYAESFLADDRDRKIFTIHKALKLLKRLNEIKVTPEEFDLAKRAMGELNTETIADFLTEVTGESIILSNLWEEYLEDAMRFYETAEARDALLETVLQVNDGASQNKTSVLVFGGFHKYRIQQILKEKGYSFFVVSPKITEMSETHMNYYKNLMSGGRHSFEPSRKVAEAAPTERVIQMFEGAVSMDYLNYLARVAKSIDPRVIKDLIAARNEVRDVEDEGPVKRFEGEEIKRIGLIGVGRQGKRHLRHLVEQEMDVLAADEYMGDDVYEQYGETENVVLEKAEADRVLQDPSIQAVIIATPGKTHYELVKRALLAGKHVLVEKPFTRDTDQARELVALAEERGLIIMIGHNRYYLPHLQRLRQVVESGQLGQILSVEGNYLNPPQKNDLTHTALEGLGYHQVYMIEAAIGRSVPDEVLHAAAGSSDWETFGMKLRYGNIPVTIRLDRNYTKEKTRNLIVRGSKFTAIFDYSHEPDYTELSFQLTQSDYIVEEDQVSEEDARLLEELRRTLSPLDEEAVRPSLHHQLLAFREAVRSGYEPPSNGRNAINVVETLEGIRNRVKGTGIDLYVSNSLVSERDLMELATATHDLLGNRGGIITVDGSAGVGKSTFASKFASLYQIIFPGSRVVTISLDEMLLAWEKRLVIKKMVIGEPLSPMQEMIATQQGWTNIREGQFFESEGILWDSHKIENMLHEMTVFFNHQYSPDEAFTVISNEKAYIKEEGKRSVKPTRRIINPGDIVVVEGKFANDIAFQRLSDIHVRLEDDEQSIRARYERERASFVGGGDELVKLMHYYDKFCWPSWAAYSKRTKEYIDMVLKVQRRDEVRDVDTPLDEGLSLETLMDRTDTVDLRDDIWFAPNDLVVSANVRDVIENLSGKYGISIDLDTWTYGLQEIQRHEIESLVVTASANERVKLFVRDTRMKHDDPNIDEQYERLRNLPNVQFISGDHLFNNEGRKVIAVNKTGLPSEWHSQLTDEWSDEDFYYPIMIHEAEETAGRVAAAIMLLDSGKDGILRQQILFDQFVDINRMNVVEQMIMTYVYTATSA